MENLIEKSSSVIEESLPNTEIKYSSEENNDLKHSVEENNEAIEDSNTKANEETDNDNLVQNGDKTNDNGATGHGAVVAAHYNMLEEKGLSERNQSRIVYLRNFNNWIKSMLINEFLEKVRNSKPAGAPLKVLDMCCGKGGDLFKWRNGRITHLVCVDLAETSVKQCQKRFEDIQERMRRDRNFQRCFTAEFIPADCTKVRLRTHYKDPSISLDLVSCQFSFHYSFESLAQAECMLQNAAECLQPGGFFIGTMPDANEIMARLEASESLSFGNDVYRITFDSEKKPYALFGGKYDFHLEGVVNCPEFLVHFPTLERLAEKYGLQKVKKEKFEDFFQRMRADGKTLLGKMQALETYPAQSNTNKLVGKKDDYKHAEDHIKNSEKNIARVGTLSGPEWEAATLYLVFAFEKMKTTWDASGKPVYTPTVSKSKNKRIADDIDDDEGESSTKTKRHKEDETT
ncbi:RNA guanine-7 methyltransferase [Lycorma delicatula]|uniref:RNA guanine-7 methyltransferase n=1 Tax=Lycorma delicatula TaxID=130591 RepID=UPI003F50F98F